MGHTHLNHVFTHTKLRRFDTLTLLHIKFIAFLLRIDLQNFVKIIGHRELLNSYIKET